jgi:ABC-type multidrug transport system ATPase subunit
VLPAALEARDLAKSYGGASVFSGLSIRVEAGLVGVAGRNGSGKTTLLKILAGLLRPDSGSVHIQQGGTPLSGERRRRAIGWAGPDLAFYEELTPRENLLFFQRAAGFIPVSGEIERRLGDVGLGGDASNLPVRALSTGMRQRLRLAFAGLFDPPILLLDEPMVGLDAAGRQLVSGLIAARRKTGAVLLASNDERDFVEPDQMLSLG